MSAPTTVHPLLAQRWSPRGFDGAHTLDDDAAVSLLEAARWAPSANNSQPWRFLLARRGDVVIDAVLHPNPQVARAMFTLLNGEPGIRLVAPLGHRAMIDAMRPKAAADPVPAPRIVVG